MNRRTRRLTPTLLAGIATAALTSSASAAEPAKLTQGADSYYRQAQEQMRRIMTQQRNTNRAKNVVLLVGDGLGFSTVTAARIFEGQQRGVDGESNVLSWEAFPYLAASKTYSHDGQVSDSAPTAVAMTAGVKTKNDIIGLDQTAELLSCDHQKTKQVTTLWEMAESIGMSTGAVSTARITHATPAATFAHIASRDWESDADMTPDALQAGCTDIARQLVEMPHGDGLEVAMGGGRAYFMPATADDPEDAGKKGKRKDGRDLTKAWTERHGNSGAFVWNKEQFDKLTPDSAGHVLGLFEMSHMEYEHDRAKDKGGEPSLTEMAEKAIDILAKDPEGYVLMVEGGRIDHASHAGNAYRTLTDAVAFDQAVKAVLRKVNLDETLVIVTGDHSHSLTINGYPVRGNPILGVSVDVDGKVVLGTDGKPYTTLAFANGPGSKEPKAPEPATAAATPAQTAPASASEPAGQTGAGTPPTTVAAVPAIPAYEGKARPDVTMEQATDPDYLQQALVPLASETHAGEDLGIYAIGPWAHLFQGTVEQNYIFHVIDHATRIGERAMAATGGTQPTTKAEAK